MNDIKNQLLARIDADRNVIVEFLRGFLRCKSPNPPGDTLAAAQFVAAFLERAGLTYKKVAAKEDRPNIIATTRFPMPGPHLVLNGHIDVFPVGVESEWKRDPWGGELQDGRIYGRGACDMKCGTTASIFTYAYLSGLQDQLHGRLTLTAVSDEETFGPYGARYLMDHHADEVLGDCCLNGEPSSPHSTRFGEKGPLWLKFRVATRGGHGAYVHMSKNAITIAIAVMSELQSMAGRRADEPPAVAAALDGAHDALEKAYGKGAAKTVREVTVNFGSIRGGAKVNMIAADCEFEVDVRTPVGMSQAPILEKIDAIVAKHPEVSYSVQGGNESNWCDPASEMFNYVVANAQCVSNVRPVRVVSPGGTDARLWRSRGVPAIVYGPSPDSMGAPDEHVTVEELMHVVKTHALSAFDYLASSR